MRLMLMDRCALKRPTDIIEGWVRSIYSRGMLAYYGGTGDKRIQQFLVAAYSNYTAADSTMKSDQSHQGVSQRAAVGSVAVGSVAVQCSCV